MPFRASVPLLDPAALAAARAAQQLESWRHSNATSHAELLPSSGPAGEARHATYRNETRMPIKECVVVSVLTGSGLRGLAGQKRRTAWKCWNCGTCADLDWRKTGRGLALCDRGRRGPVCWPGCAWLAWLTWQEPWRVWHWSLGERAGSPRIAGSSPLTNQQTRPDFVLFVADSMFPDGVSGTVRPHECECGPYLGNLS